MKATAGRSAHPGAFFVLNLPNGLTTGFLTVVLPFLAVREGLSVAAIAAVIGAGLLALTLQFLWSPLVELSLTLKRWHAIGALLCAASIAGIAAMPLNTANLPAISALAAAGQFATTLVSLPASGLAALAMPDAAKGRAAGWFQAGNLGGMGLGGGAGVWIASHTGSPLLAGAALAAACLGCVAAQAWLDEPERLHNRGRLGQRLGAIGKDLWSLVRERRGRSAMLLLALPIGCGAASSLFSAIAGEWRASANLVAAVTGVGGAAASALGCLAGGWQADRRDRLTAWLGAGLLVVVAGLALAFGPRTPEVFTAASLAYAFTVGAGYAAFSAVALEAVGRGAATSKYAVVAAFGNLPLAYMTALDGWAHDRWGSAGMLMLEAGICAALILAVIVSRRALGWAERAPDAVPPPHGA